jgi:soluble lytic murein transglycosylase
MLTRYRESARVWSEPIGQALYRLRLRPNHLTVMGLGVSVIAAAAFVGGEIRTGGLLLLLAGLFDFFDGSLARASGQVTPFGAFLDSVIDRYSDLVVLIGILIFLASTAETRAAIVAMAGLVGSVMVSYTKARAASIGVECNVGFMERPERMICLIAGAVTGLLEPALWVLAVLSNLTAVHRIVFTWRATRNAAIVPVLAAVLLAPAGAGAAPLAVPAAKERAWTHAVERFQQGDPAPLLRAFGADAALEGPIGDYARWLLADALARRGDLGAARRMAVSIADGHPTSRLAPSALLVGATLAVRAGDEVEAQALLKRFIGAYPDAPELPRALYLLAMTGEARGQHEAAALAYRELTILAPASEWADGASARLDALAAAGVTVPALSVGERLDRAERLLRGGVAETAVEEAERIAAEAAEPGLVVRALQVVAEASGRLRRPEVAARALEMAAARAPADRQPGLRLDQGRQLLRAGRHERALAVLAVVERTGTQAVASEALFIRARVLENLNRTAEATTAYRTLVSRYPAREVAGRALWRLGWLAYLGGDARGAEQTWLRLSELPGGRGYRIGAFYWAGRARERHAGPAAGAELYRKVLEASPRSYYGLLAATRVGAPPGIVRAPSIQLPLDPELALAEDPGFARVDLLRRIGLTEFALEELALVVHASIGDPVRLYGLSSAYLREERYHLALRILRHHFSGLAMAGDTTLPRTFWEMLYPFGWRSEVVAAAQRAGLDPFLVAAVIREESNFHHRAVSRAGARGLMQLMPATGEMQARRLGVVFGDGGILEDPGINIELGTTYLAERLREFRDPRLALAAYNAGAGNVRRWWTNRRTDDLEAFVELIPFDETRHYVKRIMLSWEEYRRIYGGD